MMKKIMMVGAVGCGKTTLIQRMLGEAITYNKTQSIETGDFIIDTPGEFLQRRQYYNSLQVTSQEVDLVAMLQSVNEKFETYPPGFSSMFSKPCIGVVTKIDLAESEAEIEQVEEALKRAGVSKIVRVSSYEDKGVDKIIKILESEE